jgi:hypothetical protein
MTPPTEPVGDFTHSTVLISGPRVAQPRRSACLEHLAFDAGPDDEITPGVVTAMAELGLDLAQEFPSR